MPCLKVTVTGESAVFHYPERGALAFSVRANGPRKEEIAKEVTSISNEVQQFFKLLCPQTKEENAAAEHPVTTFSSTNIKTWSQPNDSDGNPAANPHHASISFKSAFRDFSKMSEVIGKLLNYPNIEVDSINWRLTDETGSELASQARKMALRDAIKKAEDYAEVLQRKVTAVEVTDYSQGGYRNVAMASAPKYKKARRSFASDDDEVDALDLTPQEIEVTGSVNVIFETVSDT
ncbi:hypothetical protein PENANT_c042G03059 [Penicillium antarcticum]|uniref:SIMPL domain-containing protein n=1 Tax=Penicillium antarcticum TaxID=416450 RepID=A0A1V6PSE8_9EURO|nr:uncharacterized protein N7508_004623 [Penicillium antarcticum]KAJ5309244.1 hypothetical protein N7508_004623 [Penicillium antarcticum]OQD79915.1 hypothetical protein PENANT_c042G03059 [Penicillium antarcticum]